MLFFLIAYTVLEMDRYMQVYRAGTSFLFQSSIPALISMYYLHLYFSISLVVCPCCVIKQCTSTAKCPFRH
jgi:hypothetical protein